MIDPRGVSPASDRVLRRMRTSFSTKLGIASFKGRFEARAMMMYVGGPWAAQTVKFGIDKLSQDVII